MKTLKNKFLVALMLISSVALGATIVSDTNTQKKAVSVDNNEVALPTLHLQKKNANNGDFQVILTDSIVVKYYVSLDSSITKATATFESETGLLNSKTVEGNKVDDKWEFVYDEVTPQYIDASFSIKVNDQLMGSNYSVLSYLNEIINGSHSEAYKRVAKDLVYYGEAANAYLNGGEVRALPGTAYANEDKMSLSSKFADDTQIYSATIKFDSLPSINFGFKKASDTATITIEGNDVTSELIYDETGIYTYTLTGIYALDFNKQYTVTLKDGNNTQTLKYSINDYAARMQNSNNEAMKTLAKSLYCYGAGAKALKDYQANGYLIIKEPTYKETGTAIINDKEVTLPILNATNYSYVQKAEDGSEYKYNNGKTGVAYFTHKEYSKIVFTKEISADTFTFYWRDFNNVDVHWAVAKRFNNKITGSYIDGTYVLTINEDVTTSNISGLNSNTLPSIKLTGNATLEITSNSPTLNNLTIENAKFKVSSLTINTLALKGKDASLETFGSNISNLKELIVDGASYTSTSNLSVKNISVINEGSLTVNGLLKTTNMFVESDSTLTITATDNDAISVASDGNLRLFGNVTVNGIDGKTGICFDNANSAIYLAETSSVKISGAKFAIGCFKNTSNSVKVYYPKSATRADSKITMDGNILLSYENNLIRTTFVAE